MLLLGSFVLLADCGKGAEDKSKYYSRVQSNLCRSQDPKQNRSVFEKKLMMKQKSTFIHSFNESAPLAASLGQASAKSSPKFGHQFDSKTNLQKATDFLGNKEKRFGKEEILFLYHGLKNSV